MVIDFGAGGVLVRRNDVLTHAALVADLQEMAAISLLVAHDIQHGVGTPVPLDGIQKPSRDILQPGGILLDLFMVTRVSWARPFGLISICCLIRFSLRIESIPRGTIPDTAAFDPPLQTWYLEPFESVQIMPISKSGSSCPGTLLASPFSRAAYSKYPWLR